jgi:lipopolysaccharide export system protein LptA
MDESGNKMERILCEKNVVIRKGDQVATAQRAEYFCAEGKIVLTGNPVLKEKKGVIRSDRITFYRDSEVVEFDRIQADGENLGKSTDAKSLSPSP